MDVQATIQQEAESLLSKIVDTFEVEVTEDHGLYQVLIKAEEEAPVVIGRHGETIKAIQKLLEIIAYKKTGSSVELMVNVNDYREKQQERLGEIAARAADKVQEFKSPSYVRGLSSYERKIVHEYITKNYPDLSSESIGEGRDRRLVVKMREDGVEESDPVSEQAEVPVDASDVSELIGK